MSENNGIDYDLEACLEYNPQDGFTLEDIERVMAVHEGENDQENWRWVLKLKNGKFAFLDGGCDYTGWDCQSWAESTITETASAAAYLEKEHAVQDSLILQLLKGKIPTWREIMDSEFGLS